MNDENIDDILKRAAGNAREVDPAILGRVARSLSSNLQPVRPLPAPWILASGLVLICAAVALAGAMLLGPHGILKMSAMEIAVIFCALGILLWIAAALSVAEMVPGSGSPGAPWIVSVISCAALAVVFGLLFHDYRVVRFVPRGVACLTAGVAFALPASLAAWWLLRRGFAVDSASAALAKGTLAGLAGVAMLEIHCPIFEAPHLLVWHIAVLPVCGVAAVLAARAVRSQAESRP